MLSTQVANNTGDRTLVHAKAVCNFALAHSAAVSFFDGDDVCVSKFSSKRHDASISRMIEIADARNPFKVVHSVVGFDQVDVIDLRKIMRVGDKGHRDQSVDGDISRQWRCTKKHERIATFADSKCKNSTGYKSFASGFATRPSAETSDISEVTDFVKFRKFSNRNGSPFFDSDRHSASNSACSHKAQGG